MFNDYYSDDSENEIINLIKVLKFRVFGTSQVLVLIFYLLKSTYFSKDKLKVSHDISL